MEKTTIQTKTNSLLNIDLAASFKGQTRSKEQQDAPKATVSKPLPEQAESLSVKEAFSPNLPNSQTPSGIKGKKRTSWQAFTVICNKEIVRKVKAIARKEGLHVNEVVQAMYLEGITRYEQSHGAINTDQKRKSAKDVLFPT